MSTHSILTSRGLAKGLIPTLNTGTKGTPSSTPGNGMFNVAHASGSGLRRTGCTPPPAPRLRPVPLPRLESRVDHAMSLRVGSSSAMLPARHPCPALNRLLAYQPTHSPLTYDISTPPSSLSLPFAHLSEAATWPSSSSMQIACEGLPWPIEITSAMDSLLSCLTVLCEIFVSLQRTVSELEWAVTSPTMKRVAWDAFITRLRTNPNNAEQRPKRLDFLSGRTLFKGLSPAWDSFEKWTLHLDSK